MATLRALSDSTLDVDNLQTSGRSRGISQDSGVGNDRNYWVTPISETERLETIANIFQNNLLQSGDEIVIYTHYQSTGGNQASSSDRYEGVFVASNGTNGNIQFRITSEDQTTHTQFNNTFNNVGQIHTAHLTISTGAQTLNISGNTLNIGARFINAPNIGGGVPPLALGINSDGSLIVGNGPGTSRIDGLSFNDTTRVLRASRTFGDDLQVIIPAAAPGDDNYVEGVALQLVGPANDRRLRVRLDRGTKAADAGLARFLFSNQQDQDQDTAENPVDLDTVEDFLDDLEITPLTTAGANNGAGVEVTPTSRLFFNTTDFDIIDTATEGEVRIDLATTATLTDTFVDDIILSNETPLLGETINISLGYNEGADSDVVAQLTMPTVPGDEPALETIEVCEGSLLTMDVENVARVGNTTQQTLAGEFNELSTALSALDGFVTTFSLDGVEVGTSTDIPLGSVVLNAAIGNGRQGIINQLAIPDLAVGDVITDAADYFSYTVVGGDGFIEGSIRLNRNAAAGVYSFGLIEGDVTASEICIMSDVEIDGTLMVDGQMIQAITVSGHVGGTDDTEITTDLMHLDFSNTDFILSTPDGGDTIVVSSRSSGGAGGVEIQEEDGTVTTVANTTTTLRLLDGLDATARAQDGTEVAADSDSISYVEIGLEPTTGAQVRKLEITGSAGSQTVNTFGTSTASGSVDSNNNWVLTHDLGDLVMVQIFDTSMRAVIPDEITLTNNTVTVDFNGEVVNGYAVVTG